MGQTTNDRGHDSLRRRDVTAIVPEVYETQKRYLEEEKLMSKFQERVQEEIFFHIDQTLKQKRRDRVDTTVKKVVGNINAKHSSSNSCNLSDFDENGDEYKALQRIHYKDASNISPFINSLKTEILYAVPVRSYIFTNISKKIFD